MKIILIALLSISSLLSQDLTTPEHVHAPLLLKIIKEDAAVMKAKSKTYNIAVLYNSDEDDSEDNKDRIVNFFEEQKNVLEADGINIKIDEFEFISKGKLYAKMDNAKIHLMYICSNLDENIVRKIKFVSENLNILTMSGAEEIYQSGASATVVIGDNEVPQLLIKKDRVQKERKAIAVDYLNSTNLTME